MLPTTIRTAPKLDEFLLLSDYQSTTPQSFHDGEPVLHYHAAGAKVWLPKDQQARVPIFPADAPTFEGDSGAMISQDEIALFINSEYAMVLVAVIWEISWLISSQAPHHLQH